MKHKIIMAVFFTALFTLTNASAQSDDGFVTSSTTQQGKQFPKVNAEGKVKVQILAPEAKLVQLDIGGVKYPLTKDTSGLWTGESAPQDEGFHYYQLIPPFLFLPAHWLQWNLARYLQ